MNRLQAALANIGRQLDQRGFGWALVGGLAVSVRADPRFTRDVDLAVAVEGDPQAERLIADLRSVGYEVLETVEQEETKRFATTRPQDAADLVALMPLATEEDLDTARKLVRLIEERRYHRDRDLAGELERLKGPSGPSS